MKKYFFALLNISYLYFVCFFIFNYLVPDDWYAMPTAFVLFFSFVSLSYYSASLFFEEEE
jgi:hypothetical protein